MKISKSAIAFMLSIVCSPFLLKSQSVAGKPRLVIPFGHQAGILNTLFSRDDKLLITADEKMTIVSDVRSGRPLYYLQGSRPVINASNNFIATIMDSSVMVWDANSGLLVNSLKFPSKVAHIAFHPVSDLLMVERSAGKDDDEAADHFYHAAVWDIKQKTIQHEFLSGSPANGSGGDPCAGCKNNDCPISAAWFTNNGDSVRIVHPGTIRTYALNNYQGGRDACLTANDKYSSSSSVRILNNHTIGVYHDKSVSFFNEYGQPVGHWTKTTASEGPNRKVTECISPSYDYLASYTSQSIYLYNLKTGTLKYYNVDRGHVKRLTFNRASTLILVEFLNEMPRIMSAVGFTVPKSFKPADYEGFPKYVYETKTVREAADLTDNFRAAGANAQKPRSKLFGKVMTEGLGIPNPYSAVDGVMGIMVDGINIAFTNSGEIIDLATSRPISKIESLIKLSGDINLSPDKNLLLLNTGRHISIYSIPYSKLLVNLKSYYPENVFSPDSRWLAQYTGGAKLNLVDLSTGSIDSIPIDLPVWPYNTVAFTSDSRRVIVCSGKGGSVTVDIATRKVIHETKDRNFYVSADGLKYGVVDRKEQMVYIYSTSDSTKLYSFSLADNRNGSKGSKNNKNKKDNKKNGSAEESPAMSYRVSFGKNSDAFAIWTEGWLQFVKNINKPADTVVFENDLGAAISRVTISANSNYLNIQLQSGDNAILRVGSKDSFRPMIHKDLQTFSFAAIFRDLFSGNLEKLLRGRDKAQFSVTGDSVLLYNEDSIHVYDCAAGKELYSFKVDGEIKYFSVANNLIVSNYYGQLKFYTRTDVKEWFSIIPFTNGEMVYLLPNDIYSGSKSATRHLGYMQDAKSFSYKQFDYNNNRPDIVMRTLGNTDMKYLALYDSIMAMRRRREGLRETPSSVTAKAPQVLIIDEKSIPGEVKQKILSLHLSIKTFQQYPDRLAVYINGNPLGSQRGIRLSRKGYSIDTAIQVSLTQGSNNIEVSVFDASGAESFRQPLFVQYTPDSAMTRKLYFTGIGVSKYQASGHNLDYAQKDVNDVLDSLQRKYGAQMVVDTYYNEQATLENLRKIKSKLSRTQPDDVVVIYYSGHGIVDGNRPEAYFGTYDVDFNHSSMRGISINDLNDMLENIPSRNKVVFLDACHSGEINQEESASPMRRPGETDPFDLVLKLFTDHFQGNGNNIIVAARGKEVAKECESIRQGVFTYTVLKGMASMTADEDSNALLTIGELQNYITDNVIRNSSKCQLNIVQQAVARSENEYNDWVLLRNTSATYGLRSTITETTQPRPLIDVIGSTRDSINYYRNTGEVLKDKNSSLKDKADALGGLITRGVPGVFKHKDNATWLQDKYQKQKNKADQPLAEEDGFKVRYEKVKRDKVDYIIFNITSKYVIPSLRVDVNANKEIDACTDRVYTKAEGEMIDVQYLLTGEACQGKPLESGAVMYATADQYLFMVPVSELSSTPGHTQVNFILKSNMGKDPVYWPAVSAEKIFEKYYEVKW